MYDCSTKIFIAEYVGSGQSKKKISKKLATYFHALYPDVVDRNIEDELILLIDEHSIERSVEQIFKYFIQNGDRYYEKKHRKKYGF